MEKAFLYTYKTQNKRNGSLAGIEFGVIHAEDLQTAEEKLLQKMNDFSYALRITEVTENDKNGFIVFPAGLFMGFEP